jgi:hypothetical protein
MISEISVYQQYQHLHTSVCIEMQSEIRSIGFKDGIGKGCNGVRSIEMFHSDIRSSPAQRVTLRIVDRILVDNR